MGDAEKHKTLFFEHNLADSTQVGGPPGNYGLEGFKLAAAGASSLH